MPFDYENFMLRRRETAGSDATETGAPPLQPGARADASRPGGRFFSIVTAGDGGVSRCRKQRAPRHAATASSAHRYGIDPERKIVDEPSSDGAETDLSPAHARR